MEAENAQMAIMGDPKFRQSPQKGYDSSHSSHEGSHKRKHVCPKVQNQNKLEALKVSKMRSDQSEEMYTA